METVEFCNSLLTFSLRMCTVKEGIPLNFNGFLPGVTSICPVGTHAGELNELRGIDFPPESWRVFLLYPQKRHAL